MRRPGRFAAAVLPALLLGGGCGSGDSETPTAEAEEEVVEAPREHWLGAHQSPNGRWEAAGFHRWASGERVDGPNDPGLGRPENDVGVTALAVLAYLGSGYGSRSEGKGGAAVYWGLRWLESVQGPEGRIGPATGPPWQHAVATLAVVAEAERTGDLARLAVAQHAIDFAVRSLERGDDWRSDAGPGGIPSLFWLWLALEPDRRWPGVKKRPGAELTFPVDLAASLRDELAAGIDGKSGDGRLAVAILAKLASGAEPKDPVVAAAARDLVSRPPVWPAEGAAVDFTVWWLGTLALFAVNGEPWQLWCNAMQTSIVSHQRMDGTRCDLKGSFDPVDAWGRDGGRVYSTAVLTSALSLYYAYDWPDSDSVPSPFDHSAGRVFNPCD